MLEQTSEKRLHSPRMDFPKGMELPTEYFKALELNVGDEHLTGIKVAQDLSKPSDFVFFHGAAKGNYSRVVTFARPSVEHGSSIVAFDHSGHGDSTGEEKMSSLEKKVNEGRAIIGAFAGNHPRTVSGSSMGGYIAIKMLEHCAPENLILYCPAVYGKRAYSVRFDSGFSDILRAPESWRGTDAVELLERFKGNLLVIIGSEDTVIPKGVIDLINEHSRNTKRKEIVVVPGAPHAIHAWVVEHPEEALRLGNKVAEFSSL